MQPSLSRILVETTVKSALKDIRINPERGIRNLVDKALQYSTSPCQHQFFSTVQSMLQNEHSAYYGLIRDIITHTDTEHLYTFGMNLGYNACIFGARHIRSNEHALHCTIPWALVLQINEQQFSHTQKHYQTLIEDGEALGIHAWLLFVEGSPQPLLRLASQHPDSAFFFFCEPSALTDDFIAKAVTCRNLMLVFHHTGDHSLLVQAIRRRGLLYAVWYSYSDNDVSAIINGGLFQYTQTFSPFFTLLIPSPNCSPDNRQRVQQIIPTIRSQQRFRTLPMEIHCDNRQISHAITTTTCPIYFDHKGALHHFNNHTHLSNHNIFQQTLSDILINACSIHTP